MNGRFSMDQWLDCQSHADGSIPKPRSCHRVASCWKIQAIGTEECCDKQRYLIPGSLVNGRSATSRGRLSVTTS
jgi:hypothetical protein